MLGPELAVRLPAEVVTPLTGLRIAWASPVWAMRIQGQVFTVQVRAGALGEGKVAVSQVCIGQASHSQQL